MKKKILCFDIDNVICSTSKSNYAKSKPRKAVIKLINDLYEDGHIIKIFTSRFMGRNKENAIQAKKQGYLYTYKQLKKWNLKFNKLIMGKPSFDILVDDKSLGFNKDWFKKFKI